VTGIFRQDLKNTIWYVSFDFLNEFINRKTTAFVLIDNVFYTIPDGTGSYFQCCVSYR